MTGTITPEVMWQMRADDLRMNFERVQILLEAELGAQKPDLAGGINLMLSDLTADLNVLPESQAIPASELPWGDLARLRQKCRKTFAIQLELLGGVALAHGVSKTNRGFDENFTERAERWLIDCCQPLGLKSVPVVITARGPVMKLDSEMGLVIVRSPFLDWDLWYMPLLGRAIGLLAATEDPNRKLRPIITQLLPTAHAILGEPLANRAADLDRYLRYLYADMYATAVLGPVYALPVFALDLEYACPETFALDDPDQADEDAKAPCFVPPSVHRAAAILATLENMNTSPGKPPDYTSAIEKLEQMWEQIMAPAGRADLLDEARQRFKTWHTQLYAKAILGTVSRRLGATRETWNLALAWYEYLSDQDKPSPRLPPEPVRALTELLGALWWHRINYPDKANDVINEVKKLVGGSEEVVPHRGDPTIPFPRLAACARLERLERRWARLDDILTGDRIKDEDQLAVAGRFYQLLSEQEYLLDQCQKLLQEGEDPADLWAKLSETRDSARPLQRKALEFLGGLLIHYRCLDREPAQLTKMQRGPSVCSLADDMLGRFAARSGVNWSARAIPGPDTSLVYATDVIRVPFPDWSLWNLPMMAHEFGHLVARATPEFQNYQWEEFRKVGRKDRFAHLEEFFCDVFATYVLGPAFACDALLLQFSPSEAYVPRGLHPSHHERVQVILQTLGQMNEQIGGQIHDDLEELRANLKQGWERTVRACQAESSAKAGYDSLLARSEKWGHGLYTIVNQFFRRGVGYSPRLERAHEMAERIASRERPMPVLSELGAIAARAPKQNLTLPDLLNALWWARVKLIADPISAERLAVLAYELGNDYLKG